MEGQLTSAGRAEPAVRNRRSVRRRELFEGYLCVLPWIIGFTCFTAGPMLASIVLSLMSYDVLSPPKWIGLANFEKLFVDQQFYKSLYNTAYLSFLAVPLQQLVALMFALLLNQKLRAMAFYRTAFYLPSQTPLVATAFLWLWIYNPDFGLANALLRALGIPEQQWLFDVVLAKPSLVLISLWAGAGTAMIIYLAGLQGVPETLYEAAEIDGAGAWARFANITVPMISPVMFFNLVIGIIGSFQGFFTIVYLTTQGGPINETLIYIVYIYFKAFQDFSFGYASALAWILFLVVVGVTGFQFWLAGRWVYYEGGERK